MKKILLVLLAVLIAAPFTVFSIDQVYFAKLRPLGMGGAYTALSDDQNALYYNPAGLGMIRKTELMIYDFPFRITQSTLDVFDTVKQLLELDAAVESLMAMNPAPWVDKLVGKFTSTDKLTENISSFQKLSGKKMGGGASYTVGFATRYVGLEYYNDFQSVGSLSSEVMNPIKIDYLIRNDMYLVLGIGIPIVEDFSIGFNLKGIYRSENNIKTSLFDLPIQVGNLKKEFDVISKYNYVTDPFGSAYKIVADTNLFQTPKFGGGIDLGCLYRVPEIDMVFGLVAQDLYTRFITQEYIPMSVNLGAAYKPTMPNWGWFMQPDAFVIAADLRNILGDEDIFKKLHIGTELKLMNEMLALRAGLYQGYPTYGVALRLIWIFDFAYTKYTIEKGTMAGQIPETYHLFTTAMRIKF